MNSSQVHPKVIKLTTSVNPQYPPLDINLVYIEGMDSYIPLAWQVASDRPANTSLGNSYIPLEWEGVKQNERGLKIPSFWLAQTQMTQVQWQAVMGDNPSRFNGRERPVEQVSWNDVILKLLPRLNDEGVEWIAQNIGNVKENQLLMCPVKPKWTLPTELQWEYAARGGLLQQDASFIYSGSNDIDDVAWYEDNSHHETMPVGLKLPNTLGLYDMTGNVWEWCLNAGLENYKQQEKLTLENATKSINLKNRALRGGGYNFWPELCRIDFRSYNPSRDHLDYCGLRLSCLVQFSSSK